MADSLPPPLPEPRAARRTSLTVRAIIVVCVFIGLCVVTLVALRVTGVLRPFSMPANSMSPAVNAGDQVLMRGHITPRRGDIIVFDTSDIPQLSPPGAEPQIYTKRLVGLPGETVRIADGRLFVNGQPMPMRNKDGEIRYQNDRRASYLSTAEETITVPPDSYFVLGDNSANSADSRFWGFVPAQSVLGRVTYCYGPPERRGKVQ